MIELDNTASTAVRVCSVCHDSQLSQDSQPISDAAIRIRNHLAKASSHRRADRLRPIPLQAKGEIGQHGPSRAADCWPFSFADSRL